MVKPVVLCVDDEKPVLESIKEQLRSSLDNDYIIETAESGPDALDIIDELSADGLEVGVIISDQIMPEMKGDELLKIVHCRSPRTLKILLTGQADAEAVGSAVNHANLYRYLSKPWQMTDFLMTVKEALRSYIQDKKLEEQNLELQKINQTLEELNVSLEQKVIERTAELTTANSKLLQEIVERERAENALKLANIELTRLTNLDGLTHIANRRRFDEYLDAQWDVHENANCWLSLILCDIDQFKEFNDTYGHQLGDECLKKVAQALNQAMKEDGTDLVARYGGEEFAVILPNTNPDRGNQMAEMIRQHVSALKIPHRSSSVYDYVTLSVGLATTKSFLNLSRETFVELTDQALYKAKQQGRNQVVSKVVEL